MLCSIVLHGLLKMINHDIASNQPIVNMQGIFFLLLSFTAKFDRRCDLVLNFTCYPWIPGRNSNKEATFWRQNKHQLVLSCWYIPAILIGKAKKQIVCITLTGNSLRMKTLVLCQSLDIEKVPWFSYVYEIDDWIGFWRFPKTNHLLTTGTGRCGIFPW